MSELYDRIGRGYRARRAADPRIAVAITAALGDAASVVNVGAGAGSYEPRDRAVVAIEPALAMIRQRPREAAPAVRASATALPLRDASFDAALAVLTIHHWPDRACGLAEMRRVARRRVVVLTHLTTHPFWIHHYFPGIRRSAGWKGMPSLDEIEHTLGALRREVVPVPHDCRDGFLGAYWRRPHAYLRDDVRAAISSFAQIPRDEVESGLARLRADLDRGEWQRRFGDLLGREAIDLGYRLVVAER